MSNYIFRNIFEMVKYVENKLFYCTFYFVLYFSEEILPRVWSVNKVALGKAVFCLRK